MTDFQLLVLLNIVIVICSTVLAFFVTPWCLFILLLCSTFKLKDNADSTAE